MKKATSACLAALMATFALAGCSGGEVCRLLRPMRRLRCGLRR